ncbi:arginine deiminase [Striga asiatica]|uniref:Arginine deiminase n=1 Tax=Striga asiatica TaxID=4170 RepID=A0A5A7PDN6_STRAF|nr:arginine deiminase [Striga asiatica]
MPANEHDTHCRLQPPETDFLLAASVPLSASLFLSHKRTHTAPPQIALTGSQLVAGDCLNRPDSRLFHCRPSRCHETREIRSAYSRSCTRRECEPHRSPRIPFQFSTLQRDNFDSFDIKGEDGQRI